MHAVHPGLVSTRFAKNNGAVGRIMRKVMDISSITPEQGADTAVWLTGAAEAASSTGEYWYRRQRTTPSDTALDESLGDALWASMMVWWISAILPTAPLAQRAALALTACFAVELSQLVHAPALDTLRRTFLGRLVLGVDFDPRDLLAYSLGVVVAMVGDRATRPADVA